MVNGFGFVGLIVCSLVTVVLIVRYVSQNAFKPFNHFTLYRKVDTQLKENVFNLCFMIYFFSESIIKFIY